MVMIIKHNLTQLHTSPQESLTYSPWLYIYIYIVHEGPLSLMCVVGLDPLNAALCEMIAVV